MHRLVIGVLFFAVSIGSVASAATDVTGTWSGTLQVDDHCGGRIVHWSAPVTAELLQQQDAVSGNVSLDAPEFNANCQIISTSPYVLPLSGQVSGDTLSGSVVIPDDRGPTPAAFTGTVSGETMTVNLTGENFTSTTTLTRTSTQPPGSGFTGNYNGTYHIVDDWSLECRNVGVLTYDGPISFSLLHLGSSVSGSATVGNVAWVRPDPSGNCTVTSEEVVAEISGNVSGNTIVATVFAKGESLLWIINVSGNTISGSESKPRSTFSFTASRSSTAPPTPAILSFTVNPPTINAGESSTLSWSTVNAAGVTIDNGIGGQPASGSVTVRPAATTTYSLTATGTGGTVTATVTVTVAAAAAARVVISSFPRGMVQVAGQAGGADSFALTNLGGSPTDIALSTSGNFFTVTPASFSLAAGTTQSVSITGTAQPAGSFEGTVSSGGITVSVRLLSATAPSGNVTAAATIARFGVSAPIGQNLSGSVNFMNSGSAVLQGIAVSDVPWIIPQSGVITIQPGQTQAITFTIDSSERPDAASPLGGVTGKISLVFISGASSGKQAMANPPTGNVSITIVYVVTPDVTAGSPPPLGAGELAYFIPGMSNKAKAVGDLLIANKQSNATLSDLKVYFQTSAPVPQVASLPQIGANVAVALPGLVKNVFGGSSEVGSVQIRGGDLSKVAVSALRFNNASPAGSFGTALPVFRSDRGIGPGGQMVISGVLKQAGVQTDLHVQELTGNPATYVMEFISEDGTLSTQRLNASLSGFGSREELDIVPESITAIRITNGSSGRINAYALVQSLATGDSWVVTDPAVSATSSDDTFIFPVLRAGSDAQTVFYVTNRTAAPASVTVDTRSIASRRRAAPHAMGTSLAVNTFSLRPYESLFSPSVSSTVGYVRIMSAASAMSVNARSVRVVGGNAMGSGLPALPISAAIGSGDLKRFAGVEDASPQSRAASAPGTFRTNLVLIETNRQPATVRVTLRYTFAAGAKVSAVAVSSKEYSVSASQFVVINDIARAVIGSQRDSFGDLHNMELDVEVTAGTGRFLPYLQSIDNGSGDPVVRTD